MRVMKNVRGSAITIEVLRDIELEQGTAFLLYCPDDYDAIQKFMLDARRGCRLRPRKTHQRKKRKKKK